MKQVGEFHYKFLGGELSWHRPYAGVFITFSPLFCTLFVSFCSQVASLFAPVLTPYVLADVLTVN